MSATCDEGVGERLDEAKLERAAKVKALVALLDVKRATDYDTWIHVGFCLRNENARTGHPPLV